MIVKNIFFRICFLHEVSRPPIILNNITRLASPGQIKIGLSYLLIDATKIHNYFKLEHKNPFFL